MKETCICCNGKGYIMKLRMERIPKSTIIKCKKLYGSKEGRKKNSLRMKLYRQKLAMKMKGGILSK